MFRKKAFWKKLSKETPKWVTAGIIDPNQQQAILSQYEPRKKGSVAKRLPVIVMGLAVILIGVGLFIFYAANWRKMPPGFKLFQVFALLLGTYGLSYYLLAIRQDTQRLGRAFLHLGMIAFGVGIALVAQIYHISAHPSNGVLLWCIGVLATALILQDRWGYYFTLLLSFIWNWWEYFEFHQPSYLFILLPLILIWGFYQKQAKVGVLLATLELLFWFHQITFYWANKFDQSGALSFLIMLPFGLILIMMGRAGEHQPTLVLTIRVITFVGWVSVFLPLIVLSWPVKWFSATFPCFVWNPLPVEYLLLAAIAAGLIYRRYQQGQDYQLAAACLGYGLFCFVLPLGNMSTFVIVTHLGLLAFFAGLLYASYLHVPERRIERFLAFVFPIIMIVSKGIGFLILGFDSDKFLVAYGIGFIIFGTVCLLINQSVKLFVVSRNQEFPSHILNSICAIAGFGMLYALSFKMPDQKSVFETSTVVLTLLGLFLVIAIGLYLFLWLKSSEKLIVFLSAVIFFTSLVVLVITSPDLSWVVYSLIFNALLFLMTATLLYYSTRINSAKLANLAIVGFVIQIVTRYFDVFWDMFSGALLFIITGLLALGGGYILKRHRRNVLRTIAQQTKES